MDQISAFKETVRVAREAPWHTTKAGCSVIHLEDMLDRILMDQEKSKKHRRFDRATLGRYLGWAQGIVSAYSPHNLDIEFFKNLNAKHSRSK